MIKDRKGKEVFSIREKTNTVLERAKQKINEEDQEFWAVFTGDTGSGKSLKAMHWAYTICNDINIDQVCFSVEEFVKAIIAAKKGQVIIADEAVSIFFSRAAMTKEGRLVAELAAQVRQKNLAIFLCIPDVTCLDKTIIRKLNMLVYVTENRQMKNGRKVTYKGNSTVYVESSKRQQVTMYIRYKRIKNNNPMAKLKQPSFAYKENGNPIGATFKKPWYPVSEDKYREKKESVLTKYDKSKAKPEDKPLSNLQKRHRDQRDKAIISLKNMGMQPKIIAMNLDLTHSYVRDILADKGTSG